MGTPMIQPAGEIFVPFCGGKEIQIQKDQPGAFEMLTAVDQHFIAGKFQQLILMDTFVFQIPGTVIGAEIAVVADWIEGDFPESVPCFASIIGKGGMGPKTTQGCIDNCAIHTIFPGGCAVVAAEEVVDVEGVEWLDLGMPEAMWKLKADQFGPLIVSIDSYGNNLIENNKTDFNAKREQALENLKGKLSYMD